MSVNKSRHAMNVPMKQRTKSATEEERDLAVVAKGQPEGRAVEVTPYTTPLEAAQINQRVTSIRSDRPLSAIEEEQRLVRGAAGYLADVVTTESLVLISPGATYSYNEIYFEPVGVDRWVIGTGSEDGFYIHNGTIHVSCLYIDRVTGVINFGAKAGYGVQAGVGPSGIGGTVTQITSKATPVTLDKVCGNIVTHNASLAANAVAVFTLNNTQITATDMIILNICTGNATVGTYTAWVDKVAGGYAYIAIRNVSAGPLAEALTLNFAIIKAVSS